MVPSLLRLFQRSLHAFLALVFGQGHLREDHHRLPLASLMQGMLEVLACGGYFTHLDFLGGVMTGTIVIGLLYLVEMVVSRRALKAIGGCRKVPRVLVKGERSHRSAQKLCQGLQWAS